MATSNLPYEFYIEEFGNTPVPNFGTIIFDNPIQELPTTLKYHVRIDNHGDVPLIINPFALNVVVISPFGFNVSLEQVGTPNIEVTARASLLLPLYIDLDSFAESGEMEIRIDIDPENGRFKSLTLKGTFQINAFGDGPGFQLVGPQGNVHHQGQTAVNPLIGDPAQKIAFSINNPGVSDLFIDQISLEGSDRFSLPMLSPSLVVPGGSESFNIWFDAENVKENDTFETLVRFQTNVINRPVFEFTLQVKKVKLPLEVEAIPFPNTAEQAIAIHPNALLDLKDISAIPEPQLPGIFRTTLRVWNRSGSNIYVSNFKADLSGQNIEGLKWNWEEPETLKERRKIGKNGGVFHFDGHFDYNQFKGGSFQLKISFLWRYVSQESLRTYSFILAGRVAVHKAEITPTQPSFNYLYPPSFSVDTGKGKYYYQIELALAKRFFDPDYHKKKPLFIHYGKNNPNRNFYVSPVYQTDEDGKDVFTPLSSEWRNVHGAMIFYRVLTADNKDIKNPKTSVEAKDWKDIPGLEITGAPWFGVPCHPKTQALGISIVAGSRLNTRALNSDYGPRFLPARNGSTFHPGIDIPTITGTPVYATTDGTIRRKSNSSQNRIDLVANSYRIGYVHLAYETKKGGQSFSIVEDGDEVIRGQLIGFSGKTGTGGAHLHLDGGRAGYGKNNGGTQIYSNVLKNLKYTNEHRPHKHTTISDIVARKAAGSQQKALIAFKATSVHDKDLNFVGIYVDPGSDAEQSFEFDYDEVTDQNNTQRTVNLNDGSVLRIRDPQEDIFRDNALGYDFYVQPANTQVNQAVTDRFLFVWDTSEYANSFEADASHEVEIIVKDARRSTALEAFRIGPRIAIFPGNQPNRFQISVDYFNTARGFIDLAINDLPANWNYQLEAAELQMEPGDSRLVNLQLFPPTPDAILPYNAHVTGTFRAIPDLVAKARLGLDVDVARLFGDQEIMIANQDQINFGWFAHTPANNNPLALQVLRIQNSARPTTLNLVTSANPAGAFRIEEGATITLAANEVRSITLRIDTSLERDISGEVRLEQVNAGQFSFGVKAKVLPEGTRPGKVPGFKGKIGNRKLDGLALNDVDPLIRFFWKPAEGIRGIRQYQIVLKKTNHNKWLYAPLINGSKNRFDLRPQLEYGQAYQVFIRAQDGQKIWGHFISGGIFSVNQAQPPSTVPAFKAKVDDQWLSNNAIVNQLNPTIEFSWQHATDPSGINRYQIVLQPTDGSGWQYSPHILFPQKNYRLSTQLAPGQSYSYHIRAKDNEEKWGAFVKGGVFSIPVAAPPSKVPNFRAKIAGLPLDDLTIRFEDPRIEFLWDHANSIFGIERYQIVVQPTDGSGWLFSPHVLYPAKSHPLQTNLKKGKSYSIHIRAKDTVGDWGPFVKGGVFEIV